MNVEERVYRKLLDVPRGKVTTYGELARAVGMENGQRAVGRIMNRNPYPALVPCHRVILSSGKIGGYAYGGEVKASMLAREGVDVLDGKVADFEERLHRF